jgi:hypothetical protein
MAKSARKSKEKRQQQYKYDVDIYTIGNVTPRSGGLYKSLGTVYEKIHSGGRGAAMFVRESFLRAEIKKLQPDGSWKLIEVITELDP